MSIKRSHIELSRLSNGMRAIHIHCPGTAVAYCGVIVKVGSRNESADEYGLAHFVEHTIFKGTQRRRSNHIINRMESIGGELNAYTTKEETVVYSVFPNGNLTRAAELIADLLSNSCFPDSELDKERDVVADEIESYLDTPAEAVYDDFEDLIFAGSALGHNILGSVKSLATFDSEACRNFVGRYYCASDMVAFYSGSRPSRSVFATFERYFGQCSLRQTPQIKDTVIPAMTEPFDRCNRIHSHQTHCVSGVRIPGFLDDERYAAVFLANLLGGPGMNSLLNVELRERRGLVYSVDASTSLYSDCGLLTIYFGCDPHDSERCREIVGRTVSRLADTLTPTKLAAAKKQYLGQTVVASDNRENYTLSAARSVLWRDRVISPSETESAILTLTADDIISVAEKLKSPSTLMFSPA